MKKLFILTIFTFLFSSQHSFATAQYDGKWKFTPKTTQGNCSGPPGFLTIKNGRISGYAISKDSGKMNISGKITKNGKFNGALFGQVGGFQGTIARFKGNVKGNKGVGTWKDFVRCKGTITITK